MFKMFDKYRLFNVMLFVLYVVATTRMMVVAVENEGDDPLQWLRDSIPGEPGLDYPIYSAPEPTSFSCDDKVFGGYYADPEMGCQGFHVCLRDGTGASLSPTTFLCPNGTIFQQTVFNCDWWYNVDCSEAEGSYGLADNAFGSAASSTDTDGGQCPAASPLSDSECSGIVSNCWSPGQNDVDCPNYGLCCFDGCANTCVDGPAQQASRPDPRPAADSPSSFTTPTPARETGYSYPVPDVTLPIRPVANAQPSPPSALYGAPSKPARSGRRLVGRGRRS